MARTQGSEIQTLLLMQTSAGRLLWMSFSLWSSGPAEAPETRHLFRQHSSGADPAGRVWKVFSATVGLSQHAKGGGRGPAPEGGWHIWGSSAIKRKPFDHAVQALPVHPAGGRPVTLGSEGLEHSEDPG